MLPKNPYPQPSADTVCSSWSSYLYFVHEREAIRLKREAGYPGPWTADPVLAKYRFTNVRRRDDRMTQWFIRNLIEPAETNGDDDLWFTLLVGRLINWPPTLHSLLAAGVLPCRPEDFDTEHFVTVLEAQKAKGVQVYGAAYMVYPTRKDPGGVKSASIAKWVIGDAILRRESIRIALKCGALSVEKFVSVLTECYGVSTFSAGQVAADLSYTRGVLSTAVDLYTWAPLGSGSQKGLNYLYGRDLQRLWSQSDFNSALALANTRIGDELDLPDLTLHDVQNTMCEFGKYARTVLGEGKPKSTYKPEKAY